MIKRVCILGGTGFVGHHIAHRLSTNGYTIRVVSRNPHRYKDLRVLQGLELVKGSPLDPGDLHRHLEGMDAVINLVGILTEDKHHGDFYQVHVELPRRLVQAAEDQGVRRLLHMSANGADLNSPSAYLRTKAEGEQAVLEAGQPEDGISTTDSLGDYEVTLGRGMRVTVFRPSIIFGEGDSFFTRFAKLLRLTPGVFPLPRGETRLGPVWVEDVAAAFVLALDNPWTYGQVYSLCGPGEYTFADLIRFTAELEGIHRWVWVLPERLGWLQASILEHLPGRPLTTDQFQSLAKDNVCDEPFPAIFGIEPHSIEAIVPTYIGREGRPDADLYKYRASARRHY